MGASLSTNPPKEEIQTTIGTPSIEYPIMDDSSFDLAGDSYIRDLEEDLVYNQQLLTSLDDAPGDVSHMRRDIERTISDLENKLEDELCQAYASSVDSGPQDSSDMHDYDSSDHAPARSGFRGSSKLTTSMRKRTRSTSPSAATRGRPSQKSRRTTPNGSPSSSNSSTSTRYTGTMRTPNRYTGTVRTPDHYTGTMRTLESSASMTRRNSTQSSASSCSSGSNSTPGRYAGTARNIQPIPKRSTAMRLATAAQGRAEAHYGSQKRDAPHLAATSAPTSSSKQSGTPRVARATDRPAATSAGSTSFKRPSPSTHPYAIAGPSNSKESGPLGISRPAARPTVAEPSYKRPRLASGPKSHVFGQPGMRDASAPRLNTTSLDTFVTNLVSRTADKPKPVVLNPSQLLATRPRVIRQVQPKVAAQKPNSSVNTGHSASFIDLTNSSSDDEVRFLGTNVNSPHQHPVHNLQADQPIPIKIEAYKPMRPKGFPEGLSYRNWKRACDEPCWEHHSMFLDMDFPATLANARQLVKVQYPQIPRLDIEFQLGLGEIWVDPRSTEERFEHNQILSEVYYSLDEYRLRVREERVRPDPDLLNKMEREGIARILNNVQPTEEISPGDRDQTPEGMSITLKEHQKLALAWLKKMENGQSKGGVLADDMGLGKTIEALSLIVARPSDNPMRKTTLIVAPLSLLRQWEREIKEKMKSTHQLSVFVYHGTAQKGCTPQRLRQFDIVLTTYGLLATELKKHHELTKRRENDPNAKPAPGHELNLMGEDCKWYRIILDEAQCIKNPETKAARGSYQLNAIYRLCMTGTPMMNNIQELQSLLRFLRISPYDTLKVFQQHFVTPLKKPDSAGRYGRAMTKFHALLSATLLRRTKDSLIDGKPIIHLPGKTISDVYQVLSKDEREVYAALETQSQLTFSKYLKAGTVMANYSNLLTMLLRLRQACCHPALTNVHHEPEGPKDVAQLKQMVLAAQKLSPDVVNRLKDVEVFDCPICFEGTANPTIIVPCGHNTCFECYSSLVDPANALEQGEENVNSVNCPNCRGKFNPKVATDLKCFRKVHQPELSPDDGNVTSDEDGLDDESSYESDDESDDDDCDSLDGFVVDDDDNSTCGYTKKSNKPKNSKKATKKKGKEPRKPTRRMKKDGALEDLTLAVLRRDALRNKKAWKKYMRDLEIGFEHSKKTEQAMAVLEQIRADTPTEKTIIFSQFTSFLDLLEVPIRRQGWKCQRYEGSMNMAERQEAINVFMDDAECNIMLISLKAGNAGLNLTCANHVVIMDPFWNPYIEQQAIDRTYRLGQERIVSVHRILTSNTIEDRIIQLQDVKKHLIESALDENAVVSVGKLGALELGFLFGVNDL